VAFIFLFMTAQEWLDNNGKFSDGLRILEQLGIQDEDLEKIQYRPFIPMSAVQKLRKILSKQADLAPTKKDIPNPTQEPNTIQNLRKQGRLFLKKKDALKAQLYTASDDDSRFEIARQIMEEIIPTIDDIYDQIRAFEATGQLPITNEKSIVKQTVEKMLRIQSLRPRISKLKKMLNGNLDAKARQTYEKELLEKEIELAQIREELDLD
jgi:hypothetical protein